MKSKALILIIIIMLVLSFGIWCFYYSYYESLAFTLQPPIPLMSLQLGNRANVQTGVGDKTTDIANDLNQIPNDSAAAKEMNSLDQNLNNF